MTKVRVFLAGATGVIGRLLVPLLLSGDHEVSALARSDAAAEELRDAGVGVTQADVFDAELLRGALAMAQPEVVIHLLTSLPDRLDTKDAAASFAQNDRMRIEGTRALIDAAQAADVERIVAQSIAFAYAPEGDWVKDESAPLHLEAPSPWGRSVGAVQELERQVLEASGMDGVVLRYGALYGPGTWYEGTIAQAVKRGHYPLIGDGDAMHSYLHVEDAASAAMAALTAAPGRYNVVDDDPVHAGDWLRLFAQSLDAPAPPHLERDEALERLSWTAVHRMTEQRGASNAQARECLDGWAPAHPSWRRELESRAG